MRDKTVTTAKTLDGDEERCILKGYHNEWLTNWCNGFGHFPDLNPPLLGTHGYVPEAKFVQSIMHTYKSFLYVDADEDIPDPVTHTVVSGGHNSESCDTNPWANASRARPNGMPQSKPLGAG
ncbi:hypothetical protein O181_097776 [Austropuccinia psidii MF-1]|uniref:Uncharacterized protein n=1 Tax=Austropuccinia psidii MF-1 TaxID=1389203 RepID=A0A9Q3JA26_9BASI|nr:hypothetical protein [Austropuccinia psidii MF-1]